MKLLKTIYVVSLLGTLFSAGMIGFTLHQNLLLDTIFFTPLFAAFYPIALIGTAAYGLKRVVKQMSLLDLMDKAGIDAGLGGMLSSGMNFDEEDDN